MSMATVWLCVLLALIFLQFSVMFLEMIFLPHLQKPTIIDELLPV